MDPNNGRDYNSHSYNPLLQSNSSIPGSHYYSSYPHQQQGQQGQEFFQRRASDQSSTYHQTPTEHGFEYSGSRRVSLSSLGRPHDYSPPFQSNPTSPHSPTLPSPRSRSPRTPPLTPMSHSPRKQLGRQDRPRPIVTRKATGSSTTSGGGGGGGSGGGPNRRLAHILSEQKRREKINGGFDELKSVVPE
jgi:hypothetical protein